MDSTPSNVTAGSIVMHGGSCYGGNGFVAVSQKLAPTPADCGKADHVWLVTPHPLLFDPPYDYRFCDF